MEDYRTKAVEFIIEMSKNDEKVPTEKEVNDEIDDAVQVFNLLLEAQKTAAQLAGDNTLTTDERPKAKSVIEAMTACALIESGKTLFEKVVKK